MADLTPSDLKHLSKLSNLHLTDSELTRLSPQLLEILDFVSQLQQLDTSSVPQTAQVTGLLNVTRPDAITKSLPQDVAISQAPQAHKGYVLVPAIFESSDD